MSQISIFTDGGSRGNPGPAASGVFIVDQDEKEIAKMGKYLGNTTNNIAEYSAIVEGLEWAIKNKKTHNITSINFFMDSLLAASQLNGVYRIKNDKIREIIFDIRIKEKDLMLPIVYKHIPREKNKQADFMVNLALDNELKSI